MNYMHNYYDLICYVTGYKASGSYTPFDFIAQMCLASRLMRQLKVQEQEQSAILLGRGSNQFELVQAHRINAAGRVHLEFRLGVIGAVAQPALSPVFTDELCRDVHEVALLPKFRHVGDHLPGPTNVAGLQNKSVYLPGAGPRICNAHQVFL